MEISMRKYKYLLFDADETLFDFKAAEKNAFREALEDLSMHIVKRDMLCTMISTAKSGKLLSAAK